MKTEPAQILVFVDETYPDGTDKGRIVHVALAVRLRDLEDRRPQIRGIAALRRRRQVDALKRLLSDAAFAGVIGIIDRSLIYGTVPGHRQRFDDIGTVSLADSCWVQGMAYTVDALLTKVTRSWPPWPVSVYCDDKSLTPDHFSALKSSLMEFLPTMFREETGVQLTVAAVELVSKPDQGEAYDYVADGLSLAHFICRDFWRSEISLTQLSQTIVLRDFSQLVAGNTHALEL